MLPLDRHLESPRGMVWLKSNSSTLTAHLYQQAQGKCYWNTGCCQGVKAWLSILYIHTWYKGTVSASCIKDFIRSCLKKQCHSLKINQSISKITYRSKSKLLHSSGMHLGSAHQPSTQTAPGSCPTSPLVSNPRHCRGDSSTEVRGTDEEKG